jgi:MFS family permease
MSENLLVDKELEENRAILYEITNTFKTNDKYQKIIFIIFSIAIWGASQMIVSYPSQKILPEFKCIPEGNISRNFTHITNLPNFKIVQDKECIKKYCYKNLVSEEAKDAKFSKIVVDYTTSKNFISIFDTFCDFEIFFTNLNTIIQAGRIIGSTYLSYLSDKYGRKNPYFMHIYIMVFFYISIFFIKSRVLFYLFVFFTGLNFHNFTLILAMSNEMMTVENFSIISSLTSVIFSVEGIFCTIIMILFSNVYVIYSIQLILTGILFYFSRIYVKETFSFSIKMNKFDQVIKDIKYLDEVVEMKIQEDPKRKQELKKIQKFALANEKEIKSRKSTISSDMQFTLERSFSMKRVRPRRIPDIKDNGILGPFKLIFGNQELIVNFFIFLQLFITANMNYYGPLFNVELIYDNVYVATTVLFIGGIIGEIACGFIMQSNERVKSLKIVYILLGVNDFLITLLPNGILRIILVFIGFVVTAFLFVLTLIFSTESFDVEVKSSMLTLLTNFSSLWLMVLPYILKFLPDIFYLFSFSCFISFFLVSSLKETYKKSDVDF